MSTDATAEGQKVATLVRDYAERSQQSIRKAFGYLLSVDRGRNIAPHPTHDAAAWAEAERILGGQLTKPVGRLLFRGLWEDVELTEAEFQLFREGLAALEDLDPDHARHVALDALSAKIHRATRPR